MYERQTRGQFRTFSGLFHTFARIIAVDSGIITIFVHHQTMEKRIAISKGTDLFLIPARRLVYISSDGNYSNAVTQDGRSLLLSYQLGQLEDMIADQLGETGFDFVRLGRKLIVNMDFVHYIDVARQQLILSDCAGCRHELNASREVLIKLKAYIEASIRND